MMKRIVFIALAFFLWFVCAANSFSQGLKGDFDLDGDVDGDDLTVFSRNFGNTDNLCFGNEECIDGYYCRKDVGNCHEDAAGKCVLKPQSCADVWDPVCGCDNNTYANACEASVAGVNVNHEGECEPAYCFGDEMCGPDEYCLFHPCEIETGICETKPTICPNLWDPVCGCDGKTYGNACAAAASGASVDYKGECSNECCVDLCGDGICNDAVCLSCGCPCPESTTNCPQDCFPDRVVCCESFGYGAFMEKCWQTYQWTTADECMESADVVGGGAEIVDDSFCQSE